LLGSGQNPPAPNPIRSACIVNVAHKRRKPLAPDKPTKHFTAYDLVAKASSQSSTLSNTSTIVTDQTEPSAGSLQLSTLLR
jgi:hypothetical protein